MSMKDLPPSVVSVIELAVVSEFATVSAAGVPIDTPTYCFAEDDLSLIGVATGLAYPAKAERARRNPKVGLLIEGLPGKPVVSIRGLAAVRDRNFQANALRYISETGYEDVCAAANVTWDEAKKAVWYWTRIIVDVVPEKVMWWDSADTMDSPPHVWTPIEQPRVTSDPAPAGKTSPPSKWPQKKWREIAETAASRGGPAHVTLMDGDGWPLPISVRAYKLEGNTFVLDVPKGAPWRRTGKATLTFRGVETFVGDVTDEHGMMRFTVERALPQHPLVLDPVQVLKPTDDVRASLLARLEEETRRRGQSIPVLPDTPPVRTRLSKARLEQMGLLDSLT